MNGRRDLSTPLRRFISGNSVFGEITASNLNQPIDVLDELKNQHLAERKMLVGDGVIDNFRIASLVPAGPNQEPDDPTRNFYWAKFQRNKMGITNSDPLQFSEEGALGIGGIVRATNIAEGDDSHGLRTDDTQYVVLLWVEYDVSPTLGFWFFFMPALPVGEFFGMGLEMVTDNELGFGYGPIISVPPGL